MLVNPNFQREASVFVIFFAFPSLLNFLIFSKSSSKGLEKKVILIRKALKQKTSVEFFMLLLAISRISFVFACRLFFVRNREVSSSLFSFCAFCIHFFLVFPGLFNHSKTFLPAFGNVTKSKPCPLP